MRRYGPTGLFGGFGCDALESFEFGLSWVTTVLVFERCPWLPELAEGVQSRRRLALGLGARGGMGLVVERGLRIG